MYNQVQGTSLDNNHILIIDIWQPGYFHIFNCSNKTYFKINCNINDTCGRLIKLNENKLIYISKHNTYFINFSKLNNQFEFKINNQYKHDFEMEWVTKVI